LHFALLLCGAAVNIDMNKRGKIMSVIKRIWQTTYGVFTSMKNMKSLRDKMVAEHQINHVIGR
jgi:hypothetical protein